MVSEQTISQPWVVAAICEALELRGGERVLEVGTGSGYSTAILALLAGEVISIERFPELAAGAREALAELDLPGMGSIEIRVGDGTLGAPDDAPFEAIAVHASGPAPPRALLEQLAPGGRMVIPLAEPGVDMLTVLTSTPAGVEGRHDRAVPFRPTRRRARLQRALDVVWRGYGPRFLRPQLLLARLCRPAQARAQDRDDPPRRQVAQVRARPAALGDDRPPAQPAGEDLHRGDRSTSRSSRPASSRRATSSTTTRSFAGVEETLSFMRQIYGREIDPEETVTVVRFSRVHRDRRRGSATARPPSRN